MTSSQAMKRNYEGLLLGTCIGDALGLPAEGLPPQRIAKRWQGPWKMRLLFGHGMISDDTEHVAMVSLALLRHPENCGAFQRDLARRLRWWFAALPPGVGLATAKACIKLWLGFGPQRSGVFSAGNGPAMRSAIIGAFFADDPTRRVEYVRASTRMTHTDAKAEVGAQAVAEAAALEASKGSFDAWMATFRSLSSDPEWLAAAAHMEGALRDKLDVVAFSQKLGLQRGVSGYAYHTVPVAIYSWLRHRGDYRAGLEAVIECGGDTDTVGAIAGALLGLSSDGGVIPRQWVERVVDWPISVRKLRELGQCLREGQPSPFPQWHWLLMPVRNLVLLIVVLVHGFRRLV